MAATVSTAQLAYIETNLPTVSSGYLNFQIRGTKVVKKNQVFKYFHICKLKLKVLHGHISGPGIEISYQASSSAGIQILTHSGTLVDALNLINKDLINTYRQFQQLVARYSSGQTPFSPGYKKGRYYLKRCGQLNRITPATPVAVTAYGLSQAFMNNLLDWNFMIIEGHN